jgi:MFS family permease
VINRIGARPVLIAGNAIMAAGFVIRVVDGGSIPAVILGTCIVGVGNTLSFASMPALLMASVPVSESSAVNGVNSLVRFLGNSTASAAFALAVSTMSITVSGVHALTGEALQLCFWVAAASSAIAAVIGVTLPRRGRAGEVPDPAA